VLKVQADVTMSPDAADGHAIRSVLNQKPRAELEKSEAGLRAAPPLRGQVNGGMRVELRRFGAERQVKESWKKGEADLRAEPAAVRPSGIEARVAEDRRSGAQRQNQMVP